MVHGKGLLQTILYPSFMLPLPLPWWFYGRSSSSCVVGRTPCVYSRQARQAAAAAASFNLPSFACTLVCTCWRRTHMRFVVLWLESIEQLGQAHQTCLCVWERGAGSASPFPLSIKCSDVATIAPAGCTSQMQMHYRCALVLVAFYAKAATALLDCFDITFCSKGQNA